MDGSHPNVTQNDSLTIKGHKNSFKGHIKFNQLDACIILMGTPSVHLSVEKSRDYQPDVRCPSVHLKTVGSDV